MRNIVSLVRQLLVVALMLTLFSTAVTAQQGTRAGTPSPTGATPEASPVAHGQDTFPVTITRSDGVDLVISERPERIVSLSAGGTEMLYAIGASGQLVAADIFSDYPPAADELPKVDAFQPDPEAILAHNPDLVLITYDPDGIVDALEQAGVSVLYLEVPESLDGLIEQVRLFGRVTGNTDGAEGLAAAMEARIAAVEQQLADVEDGPRVYHELDETFFTVAPDSFVGDLYTILKAENIAAGAPGAYPQLSAEIIVERNPEVIILPTGGGEGETTPEDVKARPGWDVIDAVQNDRIYEIDRDIISRPGPRIIDALEQLATLLYPDITERESTLGHHLFPSRVEQQIAA